MNDLRGLSHHRPAGRHDHELHRRESGLNPNRGTGRHEQLQGNDAVGAFFGVNSGKNSGSVVVIVMGGRMTVHVGVDATGRVVIVIIVAQVRVDERRRQSAGLQRDRESEGKKTPAHGLILLEGLVVDRAVGTEFV